MKANLIIVVLLSFFIVGCVEKKELSIDTKPKQQVLKTPEPIVTNKGALYSRRGSSLFADKKDLQVGDIIQILIEETLTNDSTNDRTTSKSNTTGIGGGLFTPLDSELGKTTSGTVSKLQRANGLLGIGFNASSGNNFTGSSSSSIDEEFTTTISAVIEEAYQNGNYFIRGTKQLLINGQKQIIEISGVIRPYDIEVDNTIKSEKLANLKILYDKEGSEMDAVEKPWGSKLIEAISPF